MFKAIRRLLPGQHQIDPALLWEAQNEIQFSPDIAWLEQYQTQLVFVVDDLQSHFKNHSLMSDGLCAGLGHAFTRDPFLMWKKPLGLESFPIPIVPNANNTSIVRWYPKPAIIKGELYAIRPYAFLALDKHRANGVQFQRRRIRLNYPFHEVKKSDDPIFDPNKTALSRTELKLHQRIFLSERWYANPSAWMYIGREDYWSNQFGESEYDAKLKTVRTFAPKDRTLGPEFTQFTRYEIK